MGFADSIKAWEEKALLAANKSVLTAIDVVGTDLTILTGDINYGKYSQGHIANNWHISINTPELSVDSPPNRAGSASFARIKAFADSQAFYRKDAVAYISNGVNYSYRVNYLGFPKGPGTNGWTWTGRVVAYGFIGKALNNLRGKYM